MKEIEDYKKGISIFSHLAKDLDLVDLSKKPGPGEWSLIEVFLHILDSDLSFADRMKRVISEDRPTLIKLDEKLYQQRLNYHPKTLATAIKLFESNREMTLFHLEILKPDDFSRVGIHSIKGEQTLLEILKFSIWHLNHHGKFLYGKRKNLGKEIEEKYI